MADLGKRDRTTGLSIIGVAFVAGLCISWWSRTTAAPPSAMPGPPMKAGVVGYPKSVDVVATLETAQSLTERTELRAISAVGVRSDGTVDVSAPGNRVRYLFSSARGMGPQPPRPPGTLPRRDTCGRQNVHIGPAGIYADPDQASSPCTFTGDALPNPHCGPKDVWRTAIRLGALPESAATVEYYRSAVGPAWRFDQPASGRHIVLYGDCQRELTGAEAMGAVP